MYHAPTAKKIPENQQKEMYDINHNDLLLC